MKLEELVTKIVEEGHLPDNKYSTIIRWSLTNKADATFPDFISALKSEKIILKEITPKVKFVKLEHSDFFITLANTYVGIERFDRGIQLFDEMERKGSTEPTMLNDYGRALLKEMEKKGTVDKAKLNTARKLIFKAYYFDKANSKECYKFPAYKNLCLLRIMEGNYYLQQNDAFAAFVLGWMSIEMTLFRIWRQYLTLKGSKKVDKLSRWDTEAIIEMLFIGNIDEKWKTTTKDLETFKKAKNDLEALRGLRNHLLHGENDNPTKGDSKKSLETALKLIPLFQSLDQEVAEISAK